MKNGGEARIGYNDVTSYFRENCSDGYEFKLM